MQVNQRTAGILLNYAGEAVKVLTALIYTPIMLRLLGQSEYDLYQLVSSTVAYLSLLSLGFGSAYVRFFSRYAVKNDHDGVARLNGMFMLIFCAMSVLCVACGGVMIAKAEWVFGSGLTAVELQKAKLLMAVLVFSMALTFPNSVFNCYVTAHERFVFQKSLNLLQGLMNPFLALPLLLLGYGSVAVVGVSAFLTAAVFVSNILFCCKKLEMRFSFSGLELGLLKEMWVFTFFIFLNQIIDQVNWNVDKFLLGRMIGTSAVAVYGVGGQINSLYMSFSNMIPSVFIPEINKIVAQNLKDTNTRLSELFVKVGRFVFVVALYIYIGFVFCGKEFIIWWAGVEYVESYYVALLLITPLVLILPHSMGIEVRRAKNLHRIPALFMFMTTIFNVFLSVWLINCWGACGAALGTFACLLINQIMIDIYYVKVVKLDVIPLLKNMACIVKALLLPIVFGLSGLWTDSLGTCVVWAGLYTIFFATALYKNVLNEEELVGLKILLQRVKRG